MQTAFPLLRLALFRIRTFRAAVHGGFVTRIGIGGIPFLFPLLYQVGLGFTPIQSGLLMMPQAMAAMSLKMTMPGILTPLRLPRRADFQHRHPRPAHRAVCDHRRGHARLAHRGASLLLRVLHLAAIYEHEHAGLCRRDRGSRPAAPAPSPAPCSRCRSVSASRRPRWPPRSSFPTGFSSSAPEMIHGIHRAFFVLGGMTILSTSFSGN